ncbi:MAG: KTSC domain-containing protein [Vallitaleaceae bacterium]|nr:KTSC domain-containing protein [Vallitaleaceae bacterium]
MLRIPVQSLNIKSIGYALGTLEIEFHDNDVYKYFHVPLHIHLAFLAAESHGTYFDDHIRNKYTFEKVI